jgi:hypothetical protein
MVSAAPSATIWNAREAEHVRRAVSQAPMRNEPSPHLYVENVFSAPAYAQMLRSFPAESALRPWAATGASGNYGRRTEINLPRETERLAPEQRAFWAAAAAMLLDADFLGALLQRFEPYARERFGDRAGDPALLRESLHATLILNQHDAGYFLGPHTDRDERVFTCLFYFPEHAGLEHLGTTLYAPLEPGFTCRGTVHHDPARFERRETIPYRANSVLVFPRTDVLFHGVHPLTADELRGSRRRGMQVQFFLHNERPREDCRTALRATVPAAMRAGAEDDVPIELTNAAARDLGSSFPYRTQLGYRWLDADGREAEPDNGIRTPLPRAIRAGETVACGVRVAAPRAPGRYVLRLSVVQEGVAWFDDVDPRNGVAQDVLVYDQSAASGGGLTVADAGEPARDIVSDAGDTALGAGWHALERDGNDAFRWVENGAVVHVAALLPVRHALRIVVEPGPGVGSAPFSLCARLADGREIGTATVSGRQTVSFALPVESPRVFSVALFAPGGGKPSPGDSRVLDFRVFSVSVARGADAAASPAPASRVSAC